LTNQANHLFFAPAKQWFSFVVYRAQRYSIGESIEEYLQLSAARPDLPLMNPLNAFA